jgi:hypothetical protein
VLHNSVISDDFTGFSDIHPDIHPVHPRLHRLKHDISDFALRDCPDLSG